VDVCIVGGGYTGLWTAYELRRAAPQLEVAVLEARYAGFGASGRNGGWVVGALSGPTRRWRARGGAQGPGAMTAAIHGAVTEVGDVIARERIECDYHYGGTLAVATSPTQLKRLRDEPARVVWYADAQQLDAAQVRERINIPSALGGQFSTHCARIQPAKLVRGLAEAAERAGAAIYEGTRAVSIAPGRVVTTRGTVDAGMIVRATEGYTAGLPGLRRALIPMNSSMIATEPLSEDVWAEIGWTGAETLRDAAHRYVYAQRTADGRIAIGGRGVPYRYGSRTDREGPVPPATVVELRERLTGLFPQLRDARVDGAWHGVLGVARDWMPAVGIDRGQGIAWAGGYVGDGVATANLAGRTLRDLILGRDTDLTRLPWVGPLARPWEPEPLRFAGVHGIYAMYREADEREKKTGKPSAFAAVANRISGR
jgi:glycine/D-amino acid oxidase-like deaminating enzyme